MRIVFVSNYLNHHQIPFCRAMQNLTKDNFYFIAMEEMTDERKNMGWGFNDEYSFHIKKKENFLLARKLVYDADIVICGGNEYMSFIRNRLEANKITFCCSERIYKKGLWKALSPRGFYYMTRNHGKYRKNSLYLLCASAYAPLDYSLTGCYIGKTYKWGYFPEFKEYDIEQLVQKKRQNKTNILWVSRFIDWKHPEYPIKLAEEFKKRGLNFQLTMIGNGILLDKYVELIERKKLSNVISIKGGLTPQQVREHMEKANIFICTSDFNEGWGAVLNEAMNSGCAVVVSHAIGATPYLVEDGINGLVYRNGRIGDFIKKVNYLVENREFAEKLGKEAYFTISSQWNSEEAAMRLYKLCECKLNNEEHIFENGPCSVAKKITGNWYKNKGM